jgi:threonine/homoserine/homoserine lactone efflux protein
LGLLSFLLEAVIVSLSGAMGPGPVTAVTIAKGNESPGAGAMVAIGHGIVELPLMLSILHGMGHLLSSPDVKAVISVVGSLFLAMMSIDMLRGVREVTRLSATYPSSPLIAGLFLSVANVGFFIWWATVGATLILRSVPFGLTGFLLFALAHWSCDLLWNCFLPLLTFRGGRFFGRKFQKTAFGICGAFLLFYSCKSFVDALRLVAG